MDVVNELKNSEHQHALHSTRETTKPTHGAASSTNTSSSDTLGEEFHRQREDARSNNPHGQSRTDTGVDVPRAEAEFAELSRELSGYSQHSPRVSRRHSTAHSRRSIKNDGDVEKTGAELSEAERWDLEEVLRGSKDADYEAGIKSKRIG